MPSHLKRPMEHVWPAELMRSELCHAKKWFDGVTFKTYRVKVVDARPREFNSLRQRRIGPLWLSTEVLIDRSHDALNKKRCRHAFQL